MAKEGNLLIVDDNSSILGALRLLLERHFAKVTTLTSPKLLDTVLRGEAVDAVLLDMNFTAGVNNGNEGIYWLRRIRDIRPDVKVVLFTAYADVDLAVRSMRDGAVDFVVKPWDNERLVASLRNACELARSQREVKRLREIRRELTVDEPMFWGTSPAMERIREIVEKVAATDANILITGENGTGKEMLAREIHRRSHRSGGPMVAVDMGAVPETLFESELFGHVKGAFTDARTDRAGKFEVADGGTLFLDEIGNLPLHLQPKLLTALQSGAIVRVGSNLPVKVDCRLISATNRDLFGMTAGGSFREDLLYRINTIHIDLPPLRQRREDILLLARTFLVRYAGKYRKPIRDFDAAAQHELVAHAWAGNIRELQHTVEKAVILCDGTEISPATLLLRPVATGPSPAAFTTFEEMERAMIEQAMERLLMPESVRLAVKPEKGAIERCFLVFENQQFEETRQISHDMVQLSFRWYRFDAHEIVRRLLYLGPMVQLQGPKVLQEELAAVLRKALSENTETRGNIQ